MEIITIASDLFEEKINLTISSKFKKESNATFLLGNCEDTLKEIPSNSCKLIISSPPYNLDKEYEKKEDLDAYLRNITPILKELSRIVTSGGSICWQVGNYVNKGEVFPLDMFYYSMFKELGLKLRNRIIWHFNHGLHASKREVL